MDVRVGDAGPDSGDHLSELTGRDLLVRGGRDDVGGGCGSRDGAGLRAGLCQGRDRGRSGIRRRLTEPDDDAADHAPLAEMDVGLGHRRLKPAEGKLPVDSAAVAADLGAELASGHGGDGGDFLVTDQLGVDLLGAGRDRHRQQGQEEEKGEQAVRSGVWHRGLLSEGDR